MYNYAVQEEFNFLFINYKKKKGERCMKNFKEILFFKKDE
jgi:hypothetical protein